MPKIDERIDALQQGFQNPTISSGTAWVDDAQMEQLKVRRKTAGQAHHKLWYLSIGELSQNPTAIFWGHRFSDCVVLAEKWRGTYVKLTKGPRKKVAAG